MNGSVRYVTGQKFRHSLKVKSLFITLVGSYCFGGGTWRKSYGTSREPATLFTGNVRRSKSFYATTTADGRIFEIFLLNLETIRDVFYGLKGGRFGGNERA